MNQDDSKKILDKVLESINKRFDGIEEQLNDSDSGLPALNRRMDVNTEAIVELESTIKGYADAYKTNKVNIERLDDRVSKLEDNSGIIPPPEFAIQR